MPNTLRRRLVLSHVLPLLLTIPLLGLALTYLLGTLVLVPSISRDLTEQAELVAQLAADHPAVWSDPAQAGRLVTRIAPQLTAGVMLLGPDGRLLASDNADDATRLGEVVTLPGLPDVLAGHESIRSRYGGGLNDDLVDVLVPVVAPDGSVLGAVRLTHRLQGVVARFNRLRYLIAVVLAVALALGTFLGWLLALNLARPLKQVTEAVSSLAGRERLARPGAMAPESLPEQGPAEVRVLLRAVNTLVARLHALESNRRQLLANLVHELGRPLGALHAAIQAMAAGAAEDRELCDELLAGMDAEVEHLRRLLDDLAQLHDRETGVLELVRRPVKLGDWLPGVLATWRVAAQAKGLAWHMELAPDLPVLSVDPDRLAQALGNLVSNAVKYTLPEGEICVRAGCGLAANGSERGAGPPAPVSGARVVWIRVLDTGPGISEDEQGLIFEPLYRGGGNRRFPQGVGLGLTIARDLVHAHGGRLTVESATGAGNAPGSAFTIWLPADGTDPHSA